MLIEPLEQRRLMAAQYTLTLLPPTSGMTVSSAYSVNESGKVVGYANAGKSYAPVLWSGGVATALPLSPTGDDVARDISDNDAVLYDQYRRLASGQFMPITTPLGNARGVAMNNGGDIAGGADGKAMLWRANGFTTTIPATGTSSLAEDVNDLGAVVGTTITANGNRPFLYDSTGYHALPVPEIAAQFGDARAINKGGLIAGFCAIEGGSFHQAVKWENGVMKSLGTLANASFSIALGINDNGDIVGYGSSMAFVYHPGGAMQDLNALVTRPSGVTLEQAWDINNKGQIVGDADTPSGRRAFLLTPISTANTASISGVVFNDLDGDGVRDTGEPGLSNTRVYVDANRDGFYQTGEKSVLSDSSGNYSIKSLAGGPYRVRAALSTSGWRRTTPSSGYYDVTLAAGGTSTARNFGNTRNVLISGSVFNDADRDKIKDAGEAGLSGWRVFIDKDGDGVFDTGENSVLTDSSGNWRFRALPAGNYTVRVVRPSGWTLTTPTGGAFAFTLGSGAIKSGLNFGYRKS